MFSNSRIASSDNPSQGVSGPRQNTSGTIFEQSLNTVQIGGKNAAELTNSAFKKGTQAIKFFGATYCEYLRNRLPLCKQIKERMTQDTKNQIKAETENGLRVERHDNLTKKRLCDEMFYYLGVPRLNLFSFGEENSSSVAKYNERIVNEKVDKIVSLLEKKYGVSQHHDICNFVEYIKSKEGKQEIKTQFMSLAAKNAEDIQKINEIIEHASFTEKYTEVIKKYQTSFEEAEEYAECYYEANGKKNIDVKNVTSTNLINNMSFSHDEIKYIIDKIYQINNEKSVKIFVDIFEQKRNVQVEAGVYKKVISSIAYSVFTPTDGNFPKLNSKKVSR